MKPLFFVLVALFFVPTLAFADDDSDDAAQLLGWVAMAQEHWQHFLLL
jgi:hypothetical protein